MIKWKPFDIIDGTIIISNLQNEFIAYNPYNKMISKFETDNYCNETIKESLSNHNFILQAQQIQRQPSLTFSVSDQCNLNCIYCFSEGIKSNNEAQFTKSVARAIDIFLASCSNKKPTIAFFGAGEPFLNTAFIKQVIEYSNLSSLKYGKEPTYLATSNCTFNSDSLDIIIKHNIYISASIDGDSCIQNRQRPFTSGANTFSVVQANITQLIDNNIPFHVRSTITDRSVKLMPNLVEYWSKKGISKVFFEPVILYNNTALCSQPSAKDFAYYFLLAFEKAKELNITIETEAIRKLGLGADKYFCPALSGDNLLYTTNGKRSFCYEELGASSENIFISNELSYSTDKIKSLLDEYNWPSEDCKVCPIAPACGFTCPKRAYETNNSFDFPYKWQCKLNKLLIPEMISKLV